ncbi:hypothetical protein [Bacillus toyonensis]|uniref:hypothetical protein n=1 Tax=Bacillus toyonensis TaxID=155322 RepID=UPI0015D49483|nr:hypothetical protein [Bacillus toyonensis]
MYTSKVKETAYQLKSRKLSMEGALASLLVSRLSHQFHRKPKHVAQDLRVQFVSIGGEA